MHLPQVALLLILVVARADTQQPLAGGIETPGFATLLAQADAQLASGHFLDAARAYSDAIDASPGQYLLFYKRATAYLSLSRHAAALADFDTVLALSPAFDKAHVMRAKILVREGRWAEARDALKSYTAKVKGDRLAGDLLFAISEGELAAKGALAAQAAGDFPVCLASASAAVQHASHNVQLRRARADCALGAGDAEQAAADLTRLTHIAPPDTELFLRAANVSFFLLPASASAQALGALKACLNTDPDSRPCAGTHRAFRALERTLAKLEGHVERGEWAIVQRLVAGDAGFAAQFDAALAEGTAGLHLPRSIDARTVSAKRRAVYEAACRAYAGSGPAGVRASEPWCAELLRMDAGNVHALGARGELLLLKEEWEEAVRVLEQAWEATGRQGGELHQKLVRAQKLLKQSRAKDYYKVLDVARDADARTIKKAYRKKAMTAHPDKGGSEAQMAAVNEAYEVLYNPELRARFDQGDDPMDPMTQQGGSPFAQGAHPFAHFFQQGGGFNPGGREGGQTFQFRWGG